MSSMDIKLRFLGAAQNVTGSRHLIEAGGTRILVDCGLYQERQFKDRNWDPFPVPPSQIDAILLTHAHLDHCGFIPKLVKDGFRGKIFCTKATAEIARIILLDSAKIQEEDAESKRKRHEKQHRVPPHPVLPLYTIEEAEASFPLFQSVPYKQTVDLGNGVEAAFYDAGHVLGSAIIRMKVRYNGEERIILFSGDIGRPDRPIVREPTVFDAADYVLVESTYGDRAHDDSRDIKQVIAEVINTTRKAGGNIVIPSFALERSQELLYYINQLILEKAIEPIRVFLDSPMASKITKVFTDHPELFDEEMTQFINNHTSPFRLPQLETAGTIEESRAINNIKEPVVIIAGSGMCTGGRIKYHLVDNITRPESTIMFVGYQAVGTLGRNILDRPDEVRILGQMYPIRAKILKVNGFSAHADKKELLKWLKEMKSAPREVFVVHGEAEIAKKFAKYVSKQTGWNVTVPAYGDVVNLK